jgi:hypothetical protein
MQLVGFRLIDGWLAETDRLCGVEGFGFERGWRRVRDF